ncbi:MAG TPA: hypothetical protein VLC28_05680 [Flavitalea sp.]|nr:hypothetical protein [Flavitalea sp.]
MKTIHTNDVYLQNKNRSTPDRGFNLKVLIVIIVALIYSMSSSAQCSGAPSLVLTNPVLMSGTDRQVGANYRFFNAAPGLDVEVSIIALNKGAALNEMDNTSQGYGDAWQPYVTAAANDTSSLDWKITFKKAGTDIDTLLPCLAITAIDIDGDSYYLNEFIQASTPGSYSIDPYSVLNVTFDGVRTTSIGPISTVPMIDTSHREVMFQMNFQNVNSIIYRNGSISTKGSDDVRHTCIYFKPFFSNYTLLPVKLTAFAGIITSDKTKLTWDAEDEFNMDSYIIQYSNTGKDFQNVANIKSANSITRKRYTAELARQTDPKGYYRLIQVDNKGNRIISKTIALTAEKLVNISPAIVTNAGISLKLNSDEGSQFRVFLYSQSGQLVHSENKLASPGINHWNISSANAKSGLYVLSIRDSSGRNVHAEKVLITGRN